MADANLSLEARDRIGAAKLYASRQYEYFSSAITALHLIEMPAVGTMGVDAYWRLYFNPEWVVKLSVEQCAGVLIHEVGHLLRRHPQRGLPLHGGSVEIHEVTNNAADMAINPDIVADGLLPLPVIDGRKFGVFPADAGLPDGLTMEEYFAKLMQQREQQQEQQEQQGQGQPGNGQQQGQGDSDGDSDGDEQGDEQGDGQPGQGQDQDQQGQPGDSDGQPGQGQGQPNFGGSCADGFKRPWELGAPQTEDDPGIGEGEQELIRIQVAEAVKSCGSAPASMKRWAETPPKRVDIRSRIRSVLASTASSLQAGQAENTYSRTRRRADAYRPLVLPGTYKRKLVVHFVMDTSGSIGDDEIALGIAGIHDVTREHDTLVVSVDARLHACKAMMTGAQVSELRKVLVGGGGTDMALAIKALDDPRSPEAREAMKRGALPRDMKRPDILIVMTDGYTGWGDYKPHAKTFIVLTCQQDDLPAWAKPINIYEGAA